MKARHKMSDLELFQAFFKEVKGVEVTKEMEEIFKEVLNEVLQTERESNVIK